LIPGLSLG